MNDVKELERQLNEIPEGYVIGAEQDRRSTDLVLERNRKLSTAKKLLRSMGLPEFNRYDWNVRHTTPTSQYAT